MSTPPQTPVSLSAYGRILAAVRVSDIHIPSQPAKISALPGTPTVRASTRVAINHAKRYITGRYHSPAPGDTVIFRTGTAGNVGGVGAV